MGRVIVTYARRGKSYETVSISALRFHIARNTSGRPDGLKLDESSNRAASLHRSANGRRSYKADPHQNSYPFTPRRRARHHSRPTRHERRPLRMPAVERPPGYWKKARAKRLARAKRKGICVDCNEKAFADIIIRDGKKCKIKRTRCAKHLTAAADRWKTWNENRKKAS